jgi:sugar phosphate isomerase/epimerase
MPYSNNKPVLGASLLTTSDVLTFFKREKRYPSFRDIALKLEDMHDHGISLLEISLYQLHFFPQFVSPAFIKRCTRQALKLGFQLTAHIPIPSVQIVAHIECLRRAGVSTILDSYKIIKEFPIRFLVTHIEGEFFDWMNKDAQGKIRNDFNERAFQAGCRSLEQILKTLPRDTLLLENLPRSNLKLLRRWTDKYNIGICLDVGHLHLAKKNMAPSFSLFRNRIKHIHLHDIVRKRSKSGKKYLEDHQALGVGILDLQAFFKLHKKYCPDAPLLLEQRWQWARRSARYIKKFL